MVPRGINAQQAKLGLRTLCRRAGAAGLLLALACGLGACGARSGPDGEPGGYGPMPGDAAAGVSGVPDAPCALCDGQIECSRCLVQAYEWTYRCAPAVSPPDDECWDLREQHVDQYGRAYTCYYCP